MWLDSRSGPQIKEYGSERLHRITGKAPDPIPALYKLYWLRDHEPGLLERSAKVVDVHGFLVHRLTGNWRTSWATADPLGLVDMERFDCSDEILSELDLGRDQLCELVSPGAVLGELRTDPILAELTQERRAYARERNILGWRGVPNALL